MGAAWEADNLSAKHPRTLPYTVSLSMNNNVTCCSFTSSQQQSLPRVSKVLHYYNFQVSKGRKKYFSHFKKKKAIWRRKYLTAGYNLNDIHKESVEGNKSSYSMLLSFNKKLEVLLKQRVLLTLKNNFVLTRT